MLNVLMVPSVLVAIELAIKLNKLMEIVYALMDILQALAKKN